MTLRLTHGALPILPLLLISMLTTSVASADGQVPSLFEQDHQG